MATAEQTGTFSFSLGSGASDKIVAGDSWERDFVFEDGQTCDPIDFTGWTPAFEIFDAGGTVLETGVVTPSPGDATGIFTAELSAAQTAAVLGTNTHRLVITSGGLRRTLFCGPFIVSSCP